jgi:hypothetical protein
MEIDLDHSITDFVDAIAGARIPWSLLNKFLVNEYIAGERPLFRAS